MLYISIGYNSGERGGGWYDHGLYKFPVHPSGNGAAEKAIELRAAVQKDCLVIRCRNTAAAPEKKDRSDPLRSHGLGLDILSRLAKTYGGSFQAGYGDGEYTAILILRFPEK